MIMRMYAIEIDHVTKTFDGHVAVDDLSLQVCRWGAFMDSLGRTDRGKTTTPVDDRARIFSCDRSGIAGKRRDNQ